MVDTSKLPQPKFIEIDADKITADIVALYEKLSGKTLYPAQADRLMIDVITYREMLIRTSINEAAKQNLLAFASGVMLDYLGDFFGVVRLDDETDEQLRTRIRLAPESYATTGSRQAYIYHALSTDASIIDAEATRGYNGNIYIHILTPDANPDSALIKAVLDNVSDEKKRPLSDLVHVQPANSVDVELIVNVHPFKTSNAPQVLLKASETIDEYIKKLKSKLGHDVVPSQIINILATDKVWQVDVVSPTNAIIIEPWQWANINSVQVALGEAQDG